LTDNQIENAKPDPSKRLTTLFDGGGLYLEIHPDGIKRWRMKFRYGGKNKLLTFGAYPAVSLEKTRAQREEARALLSEGANPVAVRREERAALLEEQNKQDSQARQKTPCRFMLDNEGALSFRLNGRCLYLTPGETMELRNFLDATQAVLFKETMPCLDRPHP
jgi:hypothetical protein